MSGSIAIPGPMAMWTLMAQGYSINETRATLRVLYIISYGVSLLLHAALAPSVISDFQLLGQLAPALLIGGIIGCIAKGYFSSNQLHTFLLILLFLTAFSLILKATIKGFI